MEVSFGYFKQHKKSGRNKPVMENFEQDKPALVVRGSAFNPAEYGIFLIGGEGTVLRHTAITHCRFNGVLMAFRLMKIWL
jgi:hypothetical protein